MDDVGQRGITTEMSDCAPTKPSELANSVAGRSSLHRIVRGHLSVTLYLGDCKDLLPMKADLLLTDPPYGIAYDPNNGKHENDSIHETVLGDAEHFDAAHLMEYRDVILWGVNNYCDSIPPKIGQWYFWDKITKNGLDVRISEAEYAWHKRGTKPRGFRHMWCGHTYRDSERGTVREHPTQKPIALFQWCILTAKLPPGSTVLDPYMGSGTSGIAAMRMDMNFVGIEKDPKHFATAVSRLEREANQGVLL